MVFAKFHGALNEQNFYFSVDYVDYIPGRMR